MSLSQPHNSGTDEDEQTLINRRSVLRVLAAGVGATPAVPFGADGTEEVVVA
jgi:hypothetical protein